MGYYTRRLLCAQSWSKREPALRLPRNAFGRNHCPRARTKDKCKVELARTTRKLFGRSTNNERLLLGKIYQLTSAPLAEFKRKKAQQFHSESQTTATLPMEVLIGTVGTNRNQSEAFEEKKFRIGVLLTPISHALNQSPRSHFERAHGLMHRQTERESRNETSMPLFNRSIETALHNANGRGDRQHETASVNAPSSRRR